MKAEILSIGTEITTGSILNTNTKYLSEKLLELGIETYYHTSVDDDIDRLRSVIQLALNRVDLIITTGGLGPTQDDLTKEVIGESLGLQLVKDEDMLEEIRKMFSSRGRHMDLNNEKQAVKLEGSEFLFNEIGTAPGIYIDYNGKKIIMLPGPPREMNLMFEKQVIPLIKEDYSIITKSMNTIGIGESSLETILRGIITNDDEINVATFPKEGEVEIKIIAKGKNKGTTQLKVDKTIELIQESLEEYIYGYDNTSIEEVIYELIKERGLTIGFCESITGGLISGKLTKVPGVSEILDRSLVTYSNKSKVEELGVSQMTLDKYGAVSEQVAREMAEGLLNKSNVDLAVSTTGIAGPTGYSEDKPIGLVYIGIATKEKTKVIRCQFNGNRRLIQNRTVSRVFSEIRDFLLK